MLMKPLSLLLTLLFCLAVPQVLAAPAHGTPKADKKAKAAKKVKKDKADKASNGKETKTKDDKEAKGGEAAMKKALAKLKYLTPKRINPKARFIIYLESGSKCANCNREMPKVVQEYKEMSEDGRVDILLICHDSNAADALGFMKKYGAEFPVVLRGDVSPETLPGYTPCHGIPDWHIVNADGTLANPGKGPVMEDWRLKTIDKPARKLPPSPAGE